MRIKQDIVNFIVCVVSLLSVALQFDMTFYQLRLYIIQGTLCHYLVFGVFLPFIVQVNISCLQR